MVRVHLVGIALLAIAAAACGESPEGRTFFERSIKPILDEKCATGTSGCHAVNTGDAFGIAAGNLDVTSFEAIQKRRDTLAPFGAYPYPLLLIKAVGPGKLQFQYNGQFRSIDVQHSGGGLIDVGSDAYFTLQAWLDAGATENGLRPATPAVAGEGGCTSAVPPGFDPAPFQAQAGFDDFKRAIQPLLERHGCNAGSCHGAPQSDFFLSCGDDDEQLAFNFSQAWAFVNDPVDDSQLLRVPLAAAAGGRGHTGGDQFASVDDDDFALLRTWATSVGKRPFGDGDPLRQFFADNVQPALVQRGCQFMACHSPQATNDFKLRSGSIGFFSAVALEKNYKLLRDEFLALEFADARRGRAVAKSLQENPRDVLGPVGIAHRGGGVLDTAGQRPEPASCGAFDAATATPFCTVQEWLSRERAALGAQVTDMTAGQTVPVVYVERPPASATAGRLEFDEFHGGAELKVANATFGATNQALETIDAGSGSVLSANCPGLAGGGDIQSPNVALDGDRVAFAGRASAAEPLGVFIVRISTGDCVRVTPAEPDSNGLKVHNFDPVFSPDGGFLVFASTRGAKGAPNALKSRRRLLPQSDLWRIAVSGTTADLGTLEKMTFLSNSELGPAFMREGRVTMTTEKTSDGFYQLAGRRINWDLTDYHPLLAQRSESRFVDPASGDLTTTLPSVGYSSATDIRESSTGDFLLILADTNATTGAPAVRGAAGALAIFNRSVGTFEAGRNDIAYLKSLRIVGDPAATGRAGSTAGYRRPQSLPDGRILAAFASNLAAGNFEIHMVDPRTNASTPLFTGGGGAARVDAVVAFKHPPRQLYENRRQLVFGGGVAAPGSDQAVVHMPDAPMVFTLLLGNLRRGRPLAEFDRARRLVVYREGLCPASGCAAGAGGFFESRQVLGSADLAADGSVKVALPSGTGLVFELQDGSGNSIAKMTEEHQLGPGEEISLGISRTLFNGVCGGCHGSISASELDVTVTPDALTGASASASQRGVPALPK